VQGARQSAGQCIQEKAEVKVESTGAVEAVYIEAEHKGKFRYQETRQKRQNAESGLIRKKGREEGSREE
jgi:hypothetical protein